MPIKRTVDDAIKEITNFLNGVGGAYDWDDFVSIPIRDKRLDSIRVECFKFREKYPPGVKRQYCSGDKPQAARRNIARIREGAFDG